MEPTESAKAVENARQVYDYTQKTYDAVLSMQGDLSGHVHKIVLVQALLFAALAHGQTVLVAWIEGTKIDLLWVCVVEGIGVFAAAAVVVSFLFAVRLMRVEQASVPNTQILLDHIDKSYFRSWDPASVVNALTRATARAVQENLEAEPIRNRWTKWLNISLVCGLILTVLFVAACNACRVQAAVSSGLDEQGSSKQACSGNKGEYVMADQENEQAPEQSQDTQQSKDPTPDVLDAAPQRVTRGGDENIVTKRESGGTRNRKKAGGR